MKITEMRQELSQVGVLPSQVKSEFGDLRLRETWEAAYEKYCCYEELPVIKAITEQGEVNNVVAFVSPAPPAIVSPPASPTPPPEEENAPQTKPPMLPQKDGTAPGGDREEKLRSLPEEYLDIALISSFSECVFGEQPIKHDEPVITAASPVLPQLWSNDITEVKRLSTYSLSPPFKLENNCCRNSFSCAQNMSAGSRSPPK